VPPDQPGEQPVRGRRRPIIAVALTVMSLLAVACAGGETQADPDPDPGIPIGGSGYRATIRWTTYGIPHIEAPDFGSLGFGQGWAITGDRGCELFDQVTKVRGERARWHGAGPGDAWLTSDFAYRSWDLRGRAEALWPQLSADGRELMDGYAAGVNAWVDQVGVDTLPEWCADADWVRPIDAIDLLAVQHDLAMVMSGRTMVGAVGSAAPPTGDDTPQASTAAAVAMPERPAIGGTAWALGRRATAEDTSLFALTAEFPWDGELALWENQLSIPDVLDVYGFSLVGLPGAFLGFNESLAWTQVPAGGVRATFHQLDLVPGDPTRFRRADASGGTEAMDQRVVTVEVLAGDGTVVAVERTMFTTRFGPVVELPGMAWTDQRAYAYADATLVRPTLVDQVLGAGRADSVAALEEAQAQAGATGWTATVAVSASGWALYADGSATPALDDGALNRALGRAAADPVAAALAPAGSLVVDGGDPADDWQQVDGAVAAGVLPASAQQRLQVRDWVVAAGDGEWAAASGTVAAPLTTAAATSTTGQDPTVSDTTPTTRVPREAFPAGQPTSPQGRNVLGTMRRLTGNSVRDDTPVTSGQLRVELFSNQGLLATQLVDDVVERCRAAGTASVPARTAADGTLFWEAQEVQLGAVCNLLGRWQGRWNLDDQAPAVWTQFLAAYGAADLRSPGALWIRLEDPDDPDALPAQLAPAPASGADPVAVALAEASLAVEAAGFSIDDFWREVQWMERGGERVPVHGTANGWDGGILVTRSATVSTSLAPTSTPGALLDNRTGLHRGGWMVRSGSSALLVVEFSPRGVQADGLLAFGQSSDPASPFLIDQAYRYSDRAWRPVIFTTADRDAAADRELTVQAPRP
jgi:acyl-homoserine-lactone acylase